MKKGFTLLVSVVLMIMFFIYPVRADTGMHSGSYLGITWTLNAGTLTVTSTGAGWACFNPYFDNLDEDFDPGVWELLSYADDVEKMVFGDRVFFLPEDGYFQFRDFKNLKTVELPKDDTSLGCYLFRDSTVENVIISDSVTIIEDEAFSGCTCLENIELPDGITSIGNKVFSGCKNLKEIKLPQSLKKIGNEAFSGCELISQITILKSVTSIGEDVFMGCAPDLTIDTPDGSAGYYYASVNSIPIVHNYDEWTVIKEATCVTDGSKEKICTRCGQKETEVITASHMEVEDPAVDPTCTEPGKTAGSHCSICGEVIIAQETVPATGHQFGDWIYADEENHVRTCSACGKEETQPHIWGNPYVIQEPTEDAFGVRGYICIDCGHEKTEVIPALVVHVASVTLNQTEAEIMTKSTLQLKASILPENAKNKNVTWTSSKPEVATVDEEGLVTALTYGKTNITVTTEDGEKIATCEIQTRYYDVADSSKYYFKSVYWAADHDPVITNGYGNVYFGPDLDCKREDMITFLWRAAGKPEPTEISSFKDVKNTKAYYYKAVLWAAEKGITKGYTSGKDAGKFGVGKKITREDTVTFIYRAAGKPSYTKTSKFKDVAKGKYYYDAIMWAAENGITKGYTSGEYKGKFGVGFNVLRQDIVTFLYRYNNL